LKIKKFLKTFPLPFISSRGNKKLVAVNEWGMMCSSSCRLPDDELRNFLIIFHCSASRADLLQMEIELLRIKLAAFVNRIESHPSVACQRTELFTLAGFVSISRLLDSLPVVIIHNADCLGALF
jgi:hypothetical protein